MVNTIKDWLDNIIMLTLLLLCMLTSGCIFVDDKCQYVAMIESVKPDVCLAIHILAMRFVG